MKTSVVILVLAIAVALGYLLGTESGREQKETLMAKFGSGDDESAGGADAAIA